MRTGKARHASPPKVLVSGVLLLGALAAGMRAEGAICDPFGFDADAVEEARQAVAAACDCRGATSRTEWRSCVVRVLHATRDAGKLTRSCVGHALRFEMDSTCGRPGTVVCCWQSPDSLLTGAAASIRPAGRCGRGSESPVAHRVEGCWASSPQRLIDPDRCGDGRRDPGEECDPPDGETCTAWCGRCAAARDATTLACTDQSPDNVAAASGRDGFLVTFDTTTRTGTRALVARLDRKGRPLGDPVGIASIARPSIVSRADNLTADEAGFYVSWVESVRFFGGGWRGRRVTGGGVGAGAIDDLHRFPPPRAGICGPVDPQGPLGLATTLDGTGIHFTLREVQRCGFEALVGVPFEFHPFRSGSEGVLISSGGPGRLARGTHDVAALWWVNEFAYRLPDIGDSHTTLYGGWIEPEPGAFALLADAGVDFRSSPGLAAVGDLFLATYATAEEVRGIRFSRAEGIVDRPPGLLLAQVVGETAGLTATSDGNRFVVAWRDVRGNRIRIVRVTRQGAVLDREPMEVVPARLGSFAVAANAETILVIYTDVGDPNPTARAPVAVRVVSLPN